MAAGVAASLLVRLSPPPAPGEKLAYKLQTYFQSGKRSGGGECDVRAGLVNGTFWVHFKELRDKERVESRNDHVLEIGTRRLRIIIQAEDRDPRKSPMAKPALLGLPPAGQGQLTAGVPGGASGEAISKKIFLTVSATLNTSMFTEQQRKEIAIRCPNLKREGNPAIDGFEKLTGDFTDIEEAYHYFKGILAGNDPSHDFSHSESKSGLKNEDRLNIEEMNELTIPSALYEYFSHACKEEVRALCERFGVRIRSTDRYDGTTSVRLTSDKNPGLIQAANDSFTKTFQKSIGDLKQEKIPVTSSYTLNEAIMKLNARFGKLLVKEEGNQLLLRGPSSEISAAKKFLAEKGENSQAEKNVKISPELYEFRNGIEVDTSVFKLLETILSKELEDIKDKFDTVIEKKDASCGHKMLIIFRPKVKTFDMSSHATESFINAFQSACAMLGEKPISLKLSEDQKKILDMMLNGKELEDLHVKLKKKEDKYILKGLPNYLYAAEKHIKNLLITEDSTQTKNRIPLSSDLSYPEDTGAPEKKYNGRQKNNLSSESQAKATTEEDVCPICMETIKNKEILKKCKHAFCESCIKQAMTYKQVCPTCNTVYGPMKGNQPEGTMTTKLIQSSLEGYPGCGTIEITYNMKGGIQTDDHPNPGKPYLAVCRRAYLPNNKEGKEVLQLLRKAFEQKLIFTVGQSRTTGEEDVITWNDIHHKTVMTGGPTNFGYPDPDYLQRVRSELKAKGIE